VRPEAHLIDNAVIAAVTRAAEGEQGPLGSSVLTGVLALKNRAEQG
jgi:hypothetical protein